MTARYATQRSKNNKTHANAFAMVAEALGFELFKWQRELAEVALEVDDTGSYKYNQVTYTMPRQNGKTAWASCRIAMELLKPGKICAFTSQDRGMARVKWQEHVDLILDSSLSKKVDKVVRANGREQLIMQNKSVYMIVTPGPNSSRGLSLDLGVIDEALTHNMEIIGALLPTFITKKSWQLVICSNAGNRYSSMLNHMRKLGHEAVDDPSKHPNYCYFEWSPYKDSFDHLDERVWAEAIPTLLEEHGGVRIEAVRQAASTQNKQQFCQEFLNVWEELQDTSAIPYEEWIKCERDDVVVHDPVTFGIDISPDRTIGSIGASSRSGAYTPVEVVENVQNGGRWIAQRCEELARKYKNSVFVIDQGSAASSLIFELEQAGLEVMKINGREYGRACASFYDSIMDKQLTFLPDERLTHAAELVGKRKLGDLWAWARPNSDLDITPLVACTLARWGSLNAEIKPRIAIH